MSELKLTQTSLKDLEKPTTCPTRWKGQWIDKVISFPSNENMMRGHFFEYLALGSGSGHQEDIVDLPKTTKGEPTAVEIRIREQAEVFKEMFDPKSDKWIGLTIVDTQVKLSHEDEEGVIDFIAVDTDGIPYNADLKLTYDITSTQSEYGWGNVDIMDLGQQVHYNGLYKKIHGVELKPVLFVFDYSTSKRIGRFDIEITDDGYTNWEIRKEQYWEVIQHYNEHGWTKLPSINECDRCSLECDRRVTKGGFDVVKTITV